MGSEAARMDCLGRGQVGGLPSLGFILRVHYAMNYMVFNAVRALAGALCTRMRSTTYAVCARARCRRVVRQRRVWW